MEQLARHTGTWAGTNGFRLMPGDPAEEAGLRAEVSLAAKGGLATVTYAWSHPDDGEQEGLLVVGPAESPGALRALWADSWHQHPAPMTLDGTASGGVLAVGYAYAGDWRWTIVLDTTDPAALVLRMDNTIPASAATAAMPAGTYAAMAATLSRVRAA